MKTQIWQHNRKKVIFPFFVLQVLTDKHVLGGLNDSSCDDGNVVFLAQAQRSFQQKKTTSSISNRITVIR